MVSGHLGSSHGTLDTARLCCSCKASIASGKPQKIASAVASSSSSGTASAACATQLEAHPCASPAKQHCCRSRTRIAPSGSRLHHSVRSSAALLPRPGSAAQVSQAAHRRRQRAQAGCRSSAAPAGCTDAASRRLWLPPTPRRSSSTRQAVTSLRHIQVNALRQPAGERSRDMPASGNRHIRPPHGHGTLSLLSQASSQSLQEAARPQSGRARSTPGVGPALGAAAATAGEQRPQVPQQAPQQALQHSSQQAPRQLSQQTVRQRSRQESRQTVSHSCCFAARSPAATRAPRGSAR